MTCGRCGRRFRSDCCRLGGSTLKSTCPTAVSRRLDLNREEGRQVQCEKCFEYSTVNVGILRPLDRPRSRSAEIREPGVQASGLAECLRRLRRASPRAVTISPKTTVGALGINGALADHPWVGQRHSLTATSTATN